MLHLFVATFFWLASPALAQDDTAFRVGTITYAGEDVTPSVGTFAIYQDDSALLTVAMPGGKPLFDVASPLSTANFWGSSPKRPLSGSYRAVLENKTVLEASLDPDVLLSPVENLSAVYRDETLDVTWKPLAEARTYEVILHEEGETGDVVVRRQTRRGSATFSVALGPGRYLVIVRGFNYPTDVVPLPATSLAVSETLRRLSVH